MPTESKIVGLHIAGIDEAGRGPLAGPVTAACVVFTDGYCNPQIKDSKKLSENQREALFSQIIAASLAYAVVSVGPRRVEALNIRAAALLAMRLASDRVAAALCARFGVAALHLLIDGNAPVETKFTQETIIKGDTKVPQISAASILAKVTRDRLMRLLDKKFPDYGFAVHKGYPTAAHLERIRLHGPCGAHRKTFAGVKEWLPSGKHWAHSVRQLPFKNC